MSFDSKIIHSSFKKAKPISLDIVTKALEYLFLDFPLSAEYFAGVDMDTVKNKVVAHLISTIDNIANPTNLHSALVKINQELTTANIPSSSYSWFESSLIKSLAYFFGDDWDGELNTHWTAALSHISQATNQVADRPHLSDTPPYPDRKGSAPIGIPGATDADQKSKSLLERLNAVNKQTATLALDSEEALTPPPAAASLLDLPNMTTHRELNDSSTPLNSNINQDAMGGLAATLESVAKSVDLSNLNHSEVKGVNLPKSLIDQIQETAQTMIKRAIEAELASAMEKELEKYLQEGVAEILKNSAG